MASRRRCAFLPVSTALLAVSVSGLSGQAQSAQPPENYRGPDTYGMCAYVAGDTTYYGNTFQVSSYFKAQAQQAIQQYAQAHANGTAVKGARCYWSYKESDLATTKETDRRLLGLPGHSVKGVETGWTFRPGATSSASPTTTATAGTNANRYSNATTAAAGTTGNRYGNATTATAAGASAAANSAAATGGRASGNRTNYTTNRTVGTNVASGSGGSTAAAATTAGTGTAGTTSTSGTGTMSSMTGGAQQQLSDAKTGAISSATAGVTSITTSAVGGATSAMQGLGSRMFHGKGSQTAAPAATGTAAAAGTGAPSANQMASGAPVSAAAPQEVASNAPGLGLGVAADAAAPPAGAVPNGAPVNVEGLVADVAGNDLIINIGQGAGISAGMRLVVMHPQRVVKDPATGKVLRSVEDQVGELKVTSADAASASGTFTGKGTPVVGDKVRLAPK